MHHDYQGQGVDQLKDCITKIISNPEDRRLIMTGAAAILSLGSSHHFSPQHNLFFWIELAAFLFPIRWTVIRSMWYVTNTLLCVLIRMSMHTTLSPPPSHHLLLLLLLLLLLQISPLLSLSCYALSPLLSSCSLESLWSGQDGSSPLSHVLPILRG